MMDRRFIILIFLASFIPVIVLLSLSLGVVGTNLLSILVPLLGGENPDPTAQAVIWFIRLPRALMGLIAGAVLALAGVALQGALKNPLVSPFTIGISSGASFGAALAIVLGVGLVGIGPYLIIGNAFFFALIAAAIVMGISKLKGMTSESVILAGIAIMYFFSALITLLQYMAH
ncbi:MAG: iron chelate uptake ABC transporter family permease subunit [Nitrososphaerales archaeon]